MMKPVKLSALNPRVALAYRVLMGSEIARKWPWGERPILKLPVPVEATVLREISGGPVPDFFTYQLGGPMLDSFSGAYFYDVVCEGASLLRFYDTRRARHLRGQVMPVFPQPIVDD